MEKPGNAERRPSPDALLREAQQAEQGRLKIFFGAAPGVGKTHGRKETEALLPGLEIIPRRIVSYKGHTLAELDLDAISARKPSLVLVDELAHSNAPESRHPKRY